MPGGLVEVEVDGTMKSRSGQRPVERPPSGVESTGLPATVSSARTCPSPGVTISSRSTATGSSPANSGSPRTRLRRVVVAGPTRPPADRVDRGGR